MPTTDILSQDEIDALLGGVDDGQVETEAELALDDDSLQAYDFNSQDRVVRGHMPAFDIINERFARRLRDSLYKLLRRSSEVAVDALQTLKYGDYVNGLLMPTSLNLIQLEPLRGKALIVFDPQLVFMLVDNFFGGSGRFGNKIEGRDLTRTELRVINELLGLVIEDLQEAWRPVFALEVEALGAEANPRFANIAGTTEVVVVSTFQIELEGGGGELHVALPYSMVEPIRHILDSREKGGLAGHDARWSGALRHEMECAKVELSSTLTRVDLTLKELLDCQPGCVIPFEMPETVVARVDEIPVFRGRLGTSGGSLALKVEEMIKHTALPVVADSGGELR